MFKNKLNKSVGCRIKYLSEVDDYKENIEYRNICPC